MQKLEFNTINTFAVSQFNETYLPAINRQTFEQLDSKTIFDYKFKEQLLKDKMLHIIIGMDSGLLANYIFEQNLPLNAKYIFVELPNILNVLNIDISQELKNQIDVVTVDQLNGILKQESNELFIVKDQFQVIASTAAQNESFYDYLALKHQVTEIMTKEHFDLRTSFNNKIFIDKQLANIAENYIPAKILKNKFSNRSCIIIGGGPSLDEQLDWIKEHQSKLIIFAVSRIAYKLFKLGIIPHIVVSVDPQDLSFDVSNGLFNLANSSLLVTSNYVCPQIINQWTGKSVYLGERFLWEQPNPTKQNINTKEPTVANTAIHLAINMGFTQIILTGVDFCYSPLGITHTKGTLEEAAGPNLSDIGHWVNTYSGVKAETPIQLCLAMESLSKEAELNSHIDFINLSNNAAKIEHIRYQNANDIKIKNARLANYPPSKFLSLIPDFNIQEYTVHLDSCLKYIDDIILQLKKILKLSKKALKFAQQLLNQHNNSIKHAARIEAIEANIDEAFPQLSHIIKRYGFFEFSHFFTTDKIQSWTQESSRDRTIKYYEAYNESINMFLEQLYLARNKLNLRIKETISPSMLPNRQKTAHINKLCQQWIENSELGRVYVWLKYQQEEKLSLSVKDKALLNSVKNLFIERLNKKSDYHSIIKTKENNLKAATSKILLLAKQENSFGLEQLSYYLEPLIENNDQAKRLYHLALNFKYQLEQNDIKAMEHLLLIPTQFQGETELSQMIMLALKLEQISVAGDALSKIVKINQEYMPQYAHILKLQGKIQQAINVYLDYLQIFATDIPVWIKLGLFMIEINQIDAASTAFNQALNQDPQNQLVQQYIQSISSLKVEADTVFKEV